MTTATMHLETAAAAASATLRLLERFEGLAGYAGMLGACQRLAEAWEGRFWAAWEAPEEGLLPRIVRDAFDGDLAVERERETWRRAAGIREPLGRHVRTEWRKRIQAMKSLTPEVQQRLAAELRGRAIVERQDDFEVFITSVGIPEDLAIGFREAFAAAFEDALRHGQANAVMHLGVGADWTLRHPEAVQSLTDYAGYYGDRITKLVPMEWQVQVKKAIIRGLDEGQSAEQMADGIREVWADLKGWEAERIARTEAVRARSQATQVTYGEAGIQRVVWLVGGNPCPELCAPLAGKTFNLRDVPDQPRHPHCECSLAASDDDLDRLRAEALAGTGPIVPLPPAPPPRYQQGVVP